MYVEDFHMPNTPSPTAPTPSLKGSKGAKGQVGYGTVGWGSVAEKQVANCVVDLMDELDRKRALIASGKHRMGSALLVWSCLVLFGLPKLCKLLVKGFVEVDVWRWQRIEPLVKVFALT